MIEHSKIVSVLLDSLPHIKLFAGSVMVIKYGGAAQLNPILKEQFAIDIVMMYMLGIKPVIVHGGGQKINEFLDRLHIKSEFVHGHRVTSLEALKVVEMVLCGDINKELTAFLNHHGVKAVGISGKDSDLLVASPKDHGALGYVGEIDRVNKEIVMQLLNGGFIPVIAPIAASEDAHHPGFNINADIVASEIARAIGAKKIIFLTDTRGVLDGEGQICTSLNLEQIKDFESKGIISGGMIPKVHACVKAVNEGVQKAHIIDGRVEHALLLELFTSAGIGTEIVSEEDGSI